jgi:hypothetical protein
MSRHARELIRSRGNIPTRFGNFIGAQWTAPLDGQSVFHGLQPQPTANASWTSRNQRLWTWKRRLTRSARQRIFPLLMAWKIAPALVHAAISGDDVLSGMRWKKRRP